MTLARIRVIETFVMECEDHPWLAASSGNKTILETQVEEHNRIWHPNTESTS